MIKPLVPDEIYTDRKEFLEYFYKAAFEAVKRRTMSTVLLGQRRMGKSDIFDSTIVVFLDEFQNTRLPQYEFSIVGFMQEAVESNTCPHFVTGSAMSILAREILGRGSLFGRFDSHPIGPLSEFWGAELAMRAAQHYSASLTELIAPMVAARCGGNPFYIVGVVRRQR